MNKVYPKKKRGSSHCILAYTTFFIILILFSSILSGCAERKQAQFLPEIAVIGDTRLSSRTNESFFEVYREGDWVPLIVKGVNIGTSLPGRHFTQFPMSREVYYSWLKQAAELNANVIRLYTLLDPLFYQAFKEYNRSVEPAKRLWLLQEVWPEENVPEDNYFDPDYMEEYKQEIRHVIDALHGSAEIRARRSRAFGSFQADISPYLLGLLIGRELEPEEVLHTNAVNEDINLYEGRFVQAAADSNATEIWLALMCDYAMEYAQEVYGWQQPVSFVSWPTLDPLEHPTEWEPASMPYNDMAEINPAHFQIGPDNLTGFFGSYHIYPNYPDFMNNEPEYDNYLDEEGILRYGGYLREFMAVHPPYPALVAEFGMATGVATAHVHPHGLDHGGVSEQQQGEMIVRMFKTILREGYAGGVIFELMDEWAKKTWITEPYMVLFERNVFWHNALCPEQNYGLVAMESAKMPFVGTGPLHIQDGVPENTAENAGLPGKEQEVPALTSLWVDHNETYLYLGLELDAGEKAGPGSGEVTSRFFLPPGTGLLIGLDTKGPDRGTRSLPLEKELSPHGLEFVIVITENEDACLLVTSSYNRSTHSYSSPQSENMAGKNDEKWETIRPLVNRERISEDGTYFPAIYSNESILTRGNFYPERENYNSLALYYMNEDSGRLELRLPWALIGFSDPSTRQVIDDPRKYGESPLRDTLQTTTIPGVSICALSFSFDAVGEKGFSCRDIDSIVPGELHGAPLDYLPRNPAGSGFSLNLPFYTWEFWEEPYYKSRQKESFPIIKDFFSAPDSFFVDYPKSENKADAPQESPEPPVLPPPDTSGKITLAFDDGWLSVFTEAKPVMDRYDFRGVAYIITDLVVEPERMSLGHLKILQNAGWDICSHSKTHPYFLSDNLSPELIEEEIKGSKRWLVENGFTAGAQHFASPGGEVDDFVLSLIKEHHTSNRIIIEGMENIPPNDPFRLKILNVINTTTSRRSRAGLSRQRKMMNG
ncbi:MAG: polysaccharide deacetylase family protein [Syntrophales bacterium]|nr:polysaccharide deacetylase family protein [Syntrophales bacterium]